MRSLSLFFFCITTLVLMTPTGVAGGLGVTPADQFSLPEGFEVDLVYEVPGETEGSWVSLTVDPKGRLIACDQDGGLYRIDVSGDQPKVEKLTIEFEGAQGLLCAFGSLYANVNSRNFPSGVWRLTDTNGDDQYDKKEHILPLNGGSEHGPHAMILTPDGERIIMCAGNNTTLPDNIARSRAPKNWDEDHLLGRMPDARGHNADRMAPGGFILSFNPDASDIELMATGFRNEYDIALNKQGELFAYDADMEWDVGTPWYRPTRINHVISGVDFGWRNGTGKWPSYYPDSFGAAVDIGPGSPTGICFGYGAKFPKKYQNSLFICDWSYGNIHAVELTPDGSSYTGSYKTFTTAAPLPVTDILIHPVDGSMYFTIGGRQTQSGLYRIKYTGELDDEPADSVDAKAARLRGVRHSLESLHVGPPATDKLPMILEHLAHSDRAIRCAARIALEHQPIEQWRDKVTSLENAEARILGVIALTRNGKDSDKPAALAALSELDWSSLPTSQKVDWLRAFGLVAIRLGGITPDEAKPVLAKIGNQFPTGENELDRELSQVLIYLGAPDSTAKIVSEMKASPSQENQIYYAMALRNMKKGWNPDLRRQYFTWFSNIQSARGGMSFGGFIDNIKKEAVQGLSEKQKVAFASVIDPPATTEKEAAKAPRDLVKQWKVDDLLAAASDESHIPNFERGKEIFGEAQCYKCHRMGVQGGILGPDLTAAGGRFNTRDLLVSMIEPSKVISDQYGATQFLTDDGRVIVGRVVNMRGKELAVMTNMLDPSAQTKVMRDSVEETRPATTSMMPSGLLDTFTEEEIVDLIAYLRAGGRADHPVYQSVAAANGGKKNPDKQWLTFAGGEGPGAGKHIVLVSGDHEYRSEEALPQLGKILSQHLGFKCTVLFAIDPATGEINPDHVSNIPGLESLASADLVIMGLRFRNLPDDQMKMIDDYVEAGRPLIGMRTSTHAFDVPADRKYAKHSWNNKTDNFTGGFGKQVFGETWVAHHGNHGVESTRGIVADAKHPIARGIAAGDIWGPTDVYAVTLPLSGDGHVIIKGQILKGMNANDDAVADKRNDPMMPVAWTRTYKGGRVFATTMGSADDLPSEGVRRMLVNAAFWCLGMEDAIKPDFDVSIVGDYKPTPFGFSKFIPGKKPIDYELKKTASAK
ncbi:ThuA domain-containing protein [Rubripirellula reticaptiva]|uniref:Trehalose utilization n=1 Tax=Rubripirellula reticaptiva TaxID=2528013 RepID=A0A5C6FDU4_9BACT|nr:ThuA domain-containing protein [Rubripirellula reticaptiva]TWU58276.1 Trehalose utilization [Rubripirellula reticaptiva]